MHFRLLPDHQKLFFKKDIFYHLEWLKAWFDAFPHTSRPTETFLYAFAHTSRPPETFFRKDIFDRQEGLKTCFDAFSHTSRSPETFFQKRYFLPPGVVKSVFWCISTYFQTNRNVFLCICAYFPIIRNFFSEKIFFTVWSG